MARQEQDREDLLAEATALVERAELALASQEEHVVVGFRRDGSGSLYLSSEEAYHFNSRNELRRAYLNGLLYKAEKGRLVSLERVRQAGEVQLLRDELNEQQTAGFLAGLAAKISGLAQQLNSGNVRLIGHVPPEADVLGRTGAWLQALDPPIAVAASPRAG